MCALQENALLKQELTAPTYGENIKDQIVLQKKEEVKANIGRSPDYADSLVLTFATSVKGRSKAEREWDGWIDKLGKHKGNNGNRTVNKYDVLNHKRM